MNQLTLINIYLVLASIGMAGTMVTIFYYIGRMIRKKKLNLPILAALIFLVGLLFVTNSQINIMKESKNLLNENHAN